MASTPALLLGQENSVVRIKIDLSWERYCAVVELRKTWPMMYYNLLQRFYELTERLLAEGLLPVLCDEIDAAIGEAAMLGRQIEEFDLRSWLRAEKRFFEGILSLGCQDAVFRSFPVLEDFVPSGRE